MSNSKLCQGKIEVASKVLKATEVLNAVEAVSALLEKLNPPGEGCQDWAFSGLAVAGGLDEAVNASVFGMCQQFGLSSSENDFLQTVITVLSYSTIVEVAQHCVGITAGIGKIDFHGEPKYMNSTQIKF